MEHKPHALIRSDVSISGSLIDTSRSFCQKSEHDRGCMMNKMTPHHILQNSPLLEVFLVSAGATVKPKCFPRQLDN